jgi:cell wall-associated NlpC family hydrolase
MKWKRTCCVLLSAALLATGITVSASSVTTVQNQKAQNEKELKNIQSQISSLESKKSALSSELNSLNDDLVNTLLNIDMLESDLADKEVEIQEAEVAYEEAVETEERQYDSMKLRIQYLYESGNDNYLEALLSSDSMADLVNKVDYAEQIQEYDKRLLDAYKEAKQEVIELQQELDEEKEEMLILEEQMEEEKANLQSMIAQKQSQIDDFSSQLSAAKAKASEYQKKIKEQNAQIKKLQQQEAAAKAASGSSSSSKSSSSSSSSSGTTATVSGGSGTGASIASYGLKFVGCPYVAGGNSLTNGTDCSGFVNLVYANFGISVPRQSGALAAGGTTVSDANKMPGDVVCYSGHVGIYIGNNQIVHASTAKTGIKVSNMYYRSVLCIKRYW